MPRTLGLLIISLTLPLLLLATPASALTSKEKMDTCKIGASAQKLSGAKRNAFIKRCMARGAALRPAAHRLTAKQKLETCTMGAADLKLSGAKRTQFIKRCMARGDYEPPARRALKQSAMKKPAAKKPAMAKPPTQN